MLSARVKPYYLHQLDPAPGTPEELARYIDSETEKWGKVVRAAHITAD